MFRKRRHMNHRLAGIIVAFVVIFTLLASAQNAPVTPTPKGQAAMNAEEPKKSRGGPDANIKKDEKDVATNAQSAPAPPEKGGQKQRGPNDCWVTTDNSSPWFANVYVDGTYRGQVPPWGKVTFNVGAGNTTLYSRATFPDGRATTWGPRVFLCPSDRSFTWTLSQEHE